MPIQTPEQQIQTAQSPSAQDRKSQSPAPDPLARPASHAERLTREPILDSAGNPATPSTASIFKAESPIPTMLVDRELNYLQWLASKTTGKGRIIELGGFLGGSTSALVAGCRLSHPAKGTDRDTQQNILTYDAFRTIDDHSTNYTSLLALYGLKPNQSFRDRYERFNHRWLDRLTIREGWLPENATPAQEREIYPEQEPVELLFIDVAKKWDIHRTVLRTFARHLLPGAMVIQQDFFDLQTPWIPLHMWQMRDVLKPIDVLRGTPSLGLICDGDLAAALNNLWPAEQFQDRDTRNHAWQQVRSYWSERIGDADAGLFSGHAAAHALEVGDLEDAVRWARKYEAWSRSAESNGVYFCPAWPEITATLPEYLPQPKQAAAMLAAECAARGSRLDRRRPGERGTYRPFSQRCEVWHAVAQQLAGSGRQRIALFGAGRHTNWLLAESILQDAGIEVACIIDDNPRASEIAGIPIIASSEIANTDKAHNKNTRPAINFDAVLPSSDTFEPKLMTRLFALFPAGTTEIRRVYSDPQLGGVQQEPNWEYAVEVLPNTPRPQRTNPERVTDHGPDRPALGLETRRPWAEEFRDRFRVPHWCDNFAHAHELAFIWDVIEASHPKTIVEIGTASGVSTAMLAAAAHTICRDNAKVFTFDIATECYFDRSRSLGAAVAEMTPDLTDRLHLFANANAIDAASCFPIGHIDLAFIDGEHGHPAPTLDLLAMVYALRPNAWVILHDIELSNFSMDVEGVSWKDSSGAARLFEAWPFEKIQPTADTRAARNIGAIRMPQTPDQAIPVLLNNLQGPIEIGGPEAEHTAKARAILASIND